MKPETISIKTLPIEIHVVRVGNKQMTKAVFDQLQFVIDERESFIASTYVNIEGFEILGWVKPFKIIPNMYDYKSMHENLGIPKEYFYPKMGPLVYILVNEYGTLKKGITYLNWVQYDYPQLFIAV